MRGNVHVRSPFIVLDMRRASGAPLSINGNISVVLSRCALRDYGRSHWEFDIDHCRCYIPLPVVWRVLEFQVNCAWRLAGLGLETVTGLLLAICRMSYSSTVLPRANSKAE